jgi:histidinol phosphatase-like enzyme (inositol monophosphatase family)
MQRNELRALVAFGQELCDLSDRATLPRFRKSIAVANKDRVGGFDPVTEGDKAAEKAIRAAIRKRYPGHGILGEEFGAEDEGAALRWVIDPIDGTRAFIIGMPLWGTIIGLTQDGAPLLGAMSQPFTGERFWSEPGRARWRQGSGKPRTLHTRACSSLDQAVLTSTHPDLFAAGEEAQRFQALKGRVRMTRFGGDCYGYCLLAAGHVDLVVEAGLKPYDIIGLIPIIEAAGGIVTTWDGRPATDGGRILAAGDARLHAKAMAVLAGK